MTSWWNNNAKNRMKDFIVWVGDSDQPSKIYCRGYIAGRQYKSIIDCGCGLASEYTGFKNDNYAIEYTGLDSCTYFVEENRKNHISMIEAELESDLPIKDNSYECVYCREVLEHLSYYEKPIHEMIRIASKEVIIIWFITPTNEQDKINYWEKEDLYHNTYNRQKLEKFILSNNKVSSINWRFINDLSNRRDVIDQNKDIVGDYGSTEDEIIEKELEKDPGKDLEKIKSMIESKRPWIKTPKSILHIILR
jgi:hypothetical protein